MVCLRHCSCQSFLVAGIRLLWDGVSFLELTVPPKFRERMCGLCGNYDGDKANDFYGRDGTVRSYIAVLSFWQP